VSDKQQYEVTSLGLDYPSVKDGARRLAATGDVVDDIPPADIKWLVKAGAITPLDAKKAPQPEKEGDE
jgi:hypothetical protein